jgi:hypothetical protein
VPNSRSRVSPAKCATSPRNVHCAGGLHRPIAVSMRECAGQPCTSGHSALLTGPLAYPNTYRPSDSARNWGECLLIAEARPTRTSSTMGALGLPREGPSWPLANHLFADGRDPPTSRGIDPGTRRRIRNRGLVLGAREPAGNRQEGPQLIACRVLATLTATEAGLVEIVAPGAAQIVRMANPVEGPVRFRPTWLEEPLWRLASIPASCSAARNQQARRPSRGLPATA